MVVLLVRWRLSGGDVCGEGWWWWWWSARFSGFFFVGVGEGVGGNWELKVGFVAGCFCGVQGSSSSCGDFEV